jgi:hypothetical protein
LIDKTIVISNYLHFLFLSCRKAQEEIEALTQMAEQFNSKMASNNSHNNSNNNNSSAASEVQSVDLDNLFSFLSDVQSTKSNPIIEEIGEKMNELVENLDMELESVIQQELEMNLTVDMKSPIVEDTEKSLINCQKKGPSLPEPIEPPPPPPPPAQFANPTVIETKKKKTEPIYESVLPRDENGTISPIITNGSPIQSNNSFLDNLPVPPIMHIDREPQEIKKVIFYKSINTFHSLKTNIKISSLSFSLSLNIKYVLI